MKASILIASVAAAGLAAWLIRRKMSRNPQPQHLMEKPSKHLTNVFSHAKSYAHQ
ncbi:MAG: hypothetical protein ABI741_03250 [Ferruginibacter sp.]